MAKEDWASEGREESAILETRLVAIGKPPRALAAMTAVLGLEYESRRGALLRRAKRDELTDGVGDFSVYFGKRQVGDFMGNRLNNCLPGASCLVKCSTGGSPSGASPGDNVKGRLPLLTRLVLV